MAQVEIESVEKSFGSTQVLSGVSLSIADGEFVSLVGPSGCGKSTLLRIIAGLEHQDRGAIRIAGESVDGTRPSRRNLAMVFQSYALYPHLTVAENIAVPLRMRRLSTMQRLPLLGRLHPGTGRGNREIASEVQRAAEQLDIAHLLARKPGQLSGGQRQRVALGRALVRQPRAFLLDEPLSNLDAKLRVHMRSEIAQLHRSLQATFIYVTHDQAEAMTMSDRIAVMMDGEILQVDTPDSVYRRPSDIRVAEFIGSPKINILPGEIRADHSVTALGLSTGLRAIGPAGRAQVGIRPEALTVRTRGPRLKGRVVHAENLGSEVFLHVGVEGLERPLVARIDSQADSGGSQVGRDIELGIDPARIAVFDHAGRALETALAERLTEAAHG